MRMKEQPPCPEAFGEILRRYRAAAGLSQEELAARAGLSRRAVSDLERGVRRQPYPATVRRLAETLQLEAADRAALLAARRSPSHPAPRTQQRPRPALRVGERGRLPSQPTALIGRDREVLDLQLRLLRPEVRLLTLTGAGGCGKTRLAVAVAAALRASFAGRVVFVDLSPLRDPALVTAAIAETLGIDEESGQPLLARLRHSLASAPTLLVLDNVEQVVAAAPEIADLLATCPDLKILVTSRIPLRVRWEHPVVVMPLAVPDVAHLADLEALAAVPAVALFLERARAVSPDLQLGGDNAAAIALICRRLDGLPLALELAAARTPLLPPQALATRLDRCLPLLTDGPRDVPARQRTLRAAIAWSYGLLAPHEQRLFRGLAVFAGGGRLEQIEAVCREPDDPATNILAGLTSLVEQNLVRREVAPDGAPRLRMLETIGEFAREQLAASGEGEALRRRHALACVDLAEAAEPTLFSAQRRAMVARLAAERDNLRAALAWLLDAGEVERAYRLVGALTWLWYPLGQVREGYVWAERALTHAGAQQPSAGQVKAMFTAGVLALFVGDTAGARLRLDQCVALCGDLRDEVGAARARIYLGMAMALHDADDAARARVMQDQALAVFRRRSDAPWLALALLGSGVRAAATGEMAARTLCEDSLALFRQLDDTLMMAEALNTLGDIARASGDDGRAETLYVESLALLRAEGGSGIPGLLHNLGYVARRRGAHPQALGHFREALALFRANGDGRGSAECLAGVASVAVAVGQPARAARLCGAAASALQGADAALSPPNAAEFTRTQAAARSRLGAAPFAREWEVGRALSLDQASAEAAALSADVPPAPQRDPAGGDAWWGLLTPREGEVATLVARGWSNRQVATALFITEQTAETHVKRVLGKLGLASRHQVQGWADQHRRQRG